MGDYLVQFQFGRRVLATRRMPWLPRIGEYVQLGLQRGDQRIIRFFQIEAVVHAVSGDDEEPTVILSLDEARSPLQGSRNLDEG